MISDHLKPEARRRRWLLTVIDDCGQAWCARVQRLEDVLDQAAMCAWACTNNVNVKEARITVLDICQTPASRLVSYEVQR